MSTLTVRLMVSSRTCFHRIRFSCAARGGKGIAARGGHSAGRREVWRTSAHHAGIGVVDVGVLKVLVRPYVVGVDVGPFHLRRGGW